MPFSLGMLSSIQLMSYFMPAYSGGFRVPHIERLTMDDGGVVALSWGGVAGESGEVNGDDYGDLVVILPGMNNSSETGFVRRFASLLATPNASDNNHKPITNRQPNANKFLPVTLDYRGVGQAGPLKNNLVCCAQNWKDFHVIFQ